MKKAKHHNAKNQITYFQYMGFIVEFEPKQFSKIHAHFSYVWTI